MGNCWPKPVERLPSAPKATRSADESTVDSKASKNPPGSINNIIDENYNLASQKCDDIDDGIVKDEGVHHRHHQQQQEEEVPPATATAGDGVATTSTSRGPNLKIFTYEELRSATRNFSPDTVLGEGGFGRVFKGWVHEITYAPSSKPGLGIPVAVKKSHPDSHQGLKEWQAEVEFLGKFCHPNLVKLLGYCWEDKQFLLVYEYMQRRSLESHLFKKGGEILSWETRLNIAIGAAQGLVFLHTSEKQVIYRDFKASNVLLDSDFNAKLSDFGLAKLGPLNGNSHVSTGVLGTYGYAAPEYMATGHLYVKSDVFGFGVVLLEIITGRRVLDLNRPSGEHNLVDWAKPLLTDNRKLMIIMDPQLDGHYPSKAAFKTAQLILKCLKPDPKRRPSMEQVLHTLHHISKIQMKPNVDKT